MHAFHTNYSKTPKMRLNSRRALALDGPEPSAGRRTSVSLSVSMSVSVSVWVFVSVSVLVSVWRARIFEHCVQPATNLKQALYTKNAYPFGSRPCVTDCPAQRSHHIATIGDKRCVRSRWRCTWALARGIAKLGSCISAAVFMAVRLDMAALAQKLRQRHERGA